MTDSRRVLVVYTGGTLGMQLTDRGWEPGADLPGWLDELVAADFPGLRWDLVSLDPLIDSSNAGPRDWQRIIDAVREHEHSHDAFVVLHGTDTMGFCAAALHFALGSMGKPVVLTGAQRSFVVDDSDAPSNVRGALRCSLDPRFSSVAIWFDGTLMAGHHATKISSEDDHAFDSVNIAPLAVLTDEAQLVFTEEAAAAPVARLNERPKPYRDVDLVVLTLHPGLRAERLAAQLTPPPQAVVLRAYGTGNAPDNDPALLEALSAASAAGSVVVVTTQCPHGAVHLGQYAVSQGLLATGAVSGGDLTTDALVAWLTFLVCQDLSPAQIRDVVREAISEGQRRRAPD
ncbi:asparaginase [Luteococcus sp. OSA5]|uniref:asparaginase n=1 Tax=Luteococcus sp. OSA5 TaxID=3401630 RepID=UPI003B43516C